MNTDEIRRFEERLGYLFENRSLLELALTHPSVAHEQGAHTQDNQRLEFLGDAVLQLVLTAELFEKFPSMQEGDLTKARAQMVNRKTLADQGRRLDLGRVLILGRGEEQSGGRERVSSLADAFEAVLGAVYLDGGLAKAGDCIRRTFAQEFGQLDALPSLVNPKGELQELLQATSPEPPHYIQTSATGPDHDRVFECAVTHKGEELGRGTGKSKKEAEAHAAFAALTRLRAAPVPTPVPATATTVSPGT